MLHSEVNMTPFRRLVVLTFLCGLIGTHAVLAAGVIDVTTAADVEALDGFCSLREAIKAANEVAPGDDGIYNECTGGDPAGADTINLNAVGPYNIASALPTITQPLTLDGMSQTMQRANTGFRGLDISGAAVTVQSLTIQNFIVSGNGGGIRVDQGSLTLAGVTVAHNGAGGFNGGGIYSTLSNVTMDASTLLDANGVGSGASGGNLYFAGAVGNFPVLDINGSTISNGTGGPGALYSPGLYAQYADVTVTGASITGNTSSGYGAGGGVAMLSGGTLTIDGGTVISGNSVNGAGGGILIKGANAGSKIMAVVDASTITDNHTTGNSGGGISAEYATLTVRAGSVVSANTASSTGGGIEILNATTLTVNASTIGGATLADGNVTTGAYGGGIFADTLTTVYVESGTMIRFNQATRTVIGNGAGIYGNQAFINVTNSTLQQNIANTSGGGIYITGGASSGVGTLTITNSTITTNTATDYGGGVFTAFVHTDILSNSQIVSNSAGTAGGGFYQTGSSASGIIDNSVISGNQATGTFGSAAGIQNTSSASLTIRNGSRVEYNSAPNGVSGNGIYSAGNLTITGAGTTVNHNTGGAQGAGVMQGSGTLRLEAGATIDTNTSTGNYGGGVMVGTSASLIVDNASIKNNSAHTGGGIYNYGTTTLQNGAQITGNFTTTAAGGAVYNPGQLIIDGSSARVVITGNTAQTVGGGIANVTVSIYNGSFNISGARIEGNNAPNSTNGDALINNSSATPRTVANSCIVTNGETAVYSTGATITATGNWWGSSWGPYIPAANAGTGSSLSTGDSISGTGQSSSTVDVGIVNVPADYGTPSTPPIGNWLTSAPSGCLSCDGDLISGAPLTPSSNGHARLCY